MAGCDSFNDSGFFTSRAHVKILAAPLRSKTRMRETLRKEGSAQMRQKAKQIGRGIEDWARGFTAKDHRRSLKDDAGAALRY